MRRKHQTSTTSQLALVVGVGIALVLVYNWSAFAPLVLLQSEPVLPTAIPATTATATILVPDGYARVDEDAVRQTSSAHCSLSTMDDSEWKTAQCSFHSLCYQHGEFAFYQIVPEVAPPLGVDLGNGKSFLPKLHPDSALPLPRLQAGSTGARDVFVLVAGDWTKAPLQHFLRDGLFAWWLLGQHAIWRDPVHLVPVLVGGFRLSAVQQQWYDLVFPGTKLVSAELDLAPLPFPVCFPRAVAGLGMMTDHCLAPDHDYHLQTKMDMKVAVESIPCTTGRGALYYQLRQEMLANHRQPIPPSSSERILLVDRALSHLAGKFAQQFPHIRVQVLSRSDEDELDSLLPLFSSVSVFVTSPESETNVGAMFQPAGSAVLLVQAGGNSRTNFAYWNNLAYLRAVWVDAEEDDADLLARMHREFEKTGRLT